MALTQKTDFTFKHVNQAGSELTGDLATVKLNLDSQAKELRDYINGTLLVEMASVTDGDSGADNIGMTPIASIGGTGDTVQEVVEELVDHITTDRKLSDTGDFTGTLNGNPITDAEPGLSSAFYGYLGRQADDKNIFAEIIDMHYQILRGVGFHASESSDLTLSKTITATAAKGATAVVVNNITDLYQGQLIVLYLDGEYYTNVIASISTLTVNLSFPLEVAAAIGDTLHNFYINSSHANMYGYRAIADAALRNLIKPRGEKLYQRIIPSDFTFSGTGTVGDGSFAQDYTEPFAAFDTKVMTTTGVQTETATKVLYLERDMYLKIKTHAKVGTGATLNFQISNTGNTVAYYNKNKTAVGVGKSNVIEVVTYLRKGNYNLKLQLTTAGVLALGKTEIYELSTKYDLNTFDRGVHLCLGDSWFVSDYNNYLITRLEERLPNATFLNYGVGGNEIDNLYRRFTGTATNADINDDLVHYGGRKDATLEPVIDFVWVMCGTNDYTAGTTSAVFKAGMDDLMKEIIDRGAKPLIFTSSVGKVGVSTHFTLSREYADLYYNEIKTDGYEKGTWTPRLEGGTTPGTNTYTTRTGSYYKVGKLVTAQFQILLSAKDAAMAGALLISGLPYAPAVSYCVPGFGMIENLALSAGYTQFSGFTTDAAIALTQLHASLGTWDNILAAAATDTTKIFGSITYIAA